MTTTLPASPELTLEPCPFCGEAVEAEQHQKYGQPPMWSIICSGAHDTFGFSHFDKHVVVKWWNTRPYQPMSDPQIEQFESVRRIAEAHPRGPTASDALRDWLPGAYPTWGDYIALLAELRRHRSSPSSALPDEPNNDMATAGARILGATMHADNQHARAIQVYRAMAENARTGKVPEPPK